MLQDLKLHKFALSWCLFSLFICISLIYFPLFFLSVFGPLYYSRPTHKYSMHYQLLSKRKETELLIIIIAV